jgi:hypothetical protein
MRDAVDQKAERDAGQGKEDCIGKPDDRADLTSFAREFVRDRVEQYEPDAAVDTVMTQAINAIANTHQAPRCDAVTL